jgi:ABC-type branched-subunit amino acid transport system substrate-binding protein
MMPVRMRGIAAVAAFAVAAVLATTASAQKKYDPGASDTEIRIGNIMPYSGPASSYGVIGKTEAAFFDMINSEGGINGRKVNFISYDDAYSPPKAIEQARKLVESDEVLLIFQPLGTPSNSAIMKYMNAKKVPQLFVASGGTKFGDPKNFPWTMGFSAQLPERGANLRKVHSRPFSEQQDRGVLAERRRRQGSVHGIEGWAGRQGEHDHRRQVL